jgi:hypothetical protein
MRFSRHIIAAATAAMAVVSAYPALAAAHNYSGSWPVTITNSQFSNGTGCLTLNGGASGGSASLVFGSRTYHYGSFIPISGLLVITIQEPLYGQNGAIMFIGRAERHQIGPGAFENVEGGSNFDFGTATFGMKNGC